MSKELQAKYDADC